MLSRTHQTPNKIAVLRSTQLFRDLPPGVLEALAACSHSQMLERETLLYSQNEEAEALFVVCHGELRLVRSNSQGREQVVSTQRSGGVLGLVPALDGGPSHSSAIADTRSEVLCISKRDFHEMCNRHPELLWNAVRELAGGLRRSFELVEDLALRSVDQRVAQHILAVCGESGLQSKNACEIQLTMSRAEIASRLASTREMVSRAFSHLEEAGLIQILRPRLLSIPDVSALLRFADSRKILS